MDGLCFSKTIWLLDFTAQGILVARCTPKTPMLGNWQPYAPAGSDAEQVYKFASSVRPFNAQTWRDVEQYRKLFPRGLVIKGIMSPDDALRAIDVGCDGILVSNHGGRQLDQAPGSLDVLPQIRAAVGDKLTLLLDSGVRRGADILIALCLGADFCFSAGRPFTAPRRTASRGKEGDRHFCQRNRFGHGPDRLPEPRSARPRFPLARGLAAQRVIGLGGVTGAG